MQPTCGVSESVFAVLMGRPDVRRTGLAHPVEGVLLLNLIFRAIRATFAARIAL